MPNSPDEEAAFRALAAQFDAKFAEVFGEYGFKRSGSDAGGDPLNKDAESSRSSQKAPAAPPAQPTSPWQPPTISRDHPRPNLRRPPLAKRHLFTLRIELHDSKPVIWRRLRVHSDIHLHTLHLAIQGAFEWLDYHLYRFALGHPFDRNSELFLCQWDVEEGEDHGLPAIEVGLDETVQQAGDLLQYVYDYGDNWGLRVRLEEVSEAAPDSPVAECIGGRRAAPPEDCGSRRTAAELAEVVPDPARFDLDHVNEVIADYLNPDFSAALAELEAGKLGTPSNPDDSPQLEVFPAFRELVRRTPYLTGKLMIVLRLNSIEEDPLYEALDSALETTEPFEVSELDLAAEFEPLLWLLNRVSEGDGTASGTGSSGTSNNTSTGIKLTQAGYLPPAVARDFAEVLHSDTDLRVWRGKSESKLRQLTAYRSYLQRLGLLRKSKGMLLLTKAGAAASRDPLALWNHLADRFAATIAPAAGARDFDRDAAALTLLHTATGAGDLNMEQVAAELTASGWGYGDGSPVYFTDITWGGACPAVLFWFMGPRNERGWHSKRIRPAAVALAHAALLRR